MLSILNYWDSYKRRTSKLEVKSFAEGLFHYEQSSVFFIFNQTLFTWLYFVEDAVERSFRLKDKQSCLLMLLFTVENQYCTVLLKT